MDISTLQQKGNDVRIKTLEVIRAGKAGHVGGDMSEADILTVLFYDVMRYDVNNPEWENRDRYIQSKGHCVETYYAILADLGFVSKEELLSTFSHFGTRFIGHPNNKLPGVEMCSGALGHGLSVGVGMALGLRSDDNDAHVYVIMGDGEQAEGSVWEAAMAASNYKLDNLTAILDRNTMQISGTTEQVMALEPVKQKYEAFGFHVVEIDGHDMAQIKDALTLRVTNKPVLVLANTVKGKGISYMENQSKWHHGVPNEAQYQQALEELKGM